MFEQFCCIFCIRSLDIVLLLLVCAPWPLGGNIAQKERDRRQDECQNLEIRVTQSCSKYKPLVALFFPFFSRHTNYCPAAKSNNANEARRFVLT